MRSTTRKLLSLAAFASLALASTGAFAQATRTWVSGVGDDANPCSRTAPCKTFAGAISKTAAGGLINVLDPGGYGAVTIVKAITIDGSNIGDGGILVSGSNGIVINAGAADNVEIRNVNIIGVGAGTDLNGIRFLNGRSLTVSNVEIQGFERYGIDFSPAGNSFLTVVDSFIHNNYLDATPTTTGGILVAPGTAGSATVNIARTTVNDNGLGIRAYGRSLVAIRDSVFSGNATYGVFAFDTVFGTSPAQSDYSIITVSDSQLTGNGHRPVSAGAGAYASGILAEVVLSNSDVTHNEMGIRIQNSGAVRSFGNNRVYDNDATDPFTQTLPES